MTSSSKTAFWIFLGGYLFGFFLLQGLPFTFGDDLNVIFTARQTSWRTLVLAVLNPLTPAWYVHGAECLLTTRAFQTFLFKGLFEIFGYRSDIFQLFKALSYAGCGSFIFLFVRRTSGRSGIAIGASLFFYLLPPVYRSFSWIADLEILAQLFLLLSFWLLLSLYKNEGKFTSQSWLSILLLIASAWLGMKLKETARIIPFTMLGFILVHQNKNIFSWARSRRNLLLLISAFILLATVIPWKPSPELALDERSHVAIFNFNPSGLLEAGGQLLVYLGAFLLLAVVAGYSSLRRSERGRAPGPGPFLFYSLWTVLALAGFLLQFETEKNIRYLTTPLIPLIVLIFSLLGRLAGLIPARGQKAYRILFVVLLGVSLQRNLDEIIYARNFFGGIEIADFKLTRELYRDRFGTQEPTWQDLDNFYRGKGPVDPRSREIKIKDWDSNAGTRLAPENLQRLVSTWGAAYILTFDESGYRNDPEKRQIYSGNTANSSLYNLIFSRKKKSRRSIYLFKAGSGFVPGSRTSAATSTS